uniref:Large ribosomal subunit protein bL35c n=1 Tax=Monodopsis sp. MarTras21 TaxID=1745953 RepID=A0A1D8RDH8_9STRA|nr:ribosomal protein L35 [Monodopsis sp. MarTras21]
MNKSKTRKSAVKRYKKTATNNFIRRKAFKGHLLQKKSSSRKRRLLSSVTVGKTERSTVKKFFNI